MARVSTLRNSLIPVLIVTLFLFQSMTPVITTNPKIEQPLEEPNVKFSNPFVNENSTFYGHDFAGSQISIDGLIDAQVRYESALDMWHSHVVLNAYNQTPGTPDIEFTGYQQLEMCWSTMEGQVRTMSRNISGFETLMHVDDVSSYESADDIVDCALSVKKNGRKTLLYADGNNLKAAQIALQSSLYTAGDSWHTRTILENVNPTHIELEVTSSDLEWGVFRNDAGQLFEVSYTGTYWTTRLLDNGPIGEDLELHIDENNLVSLLYVKSDDVILLNIDSTVNGTISHEIIFTDQEVGPQVGLDFDDSGLIQLSSSTFDGSDSSIFIKRSLANNKNQIGPNPIHSLATDTVNETSGELAYGDFNNDGFSDLVISQPHIDTWTSSDDSINSPIGTLNGKVDVYHGSLNGISITPNLTYYGEQDYQKMGQGLTVGDFNGDSFSDLVVGSPGFNQEDGKIDVYFGSPSGLASQPETIASVSSPPEIGQKYGLSLDKIDDLDGDGIDELLILSLGDNGLGELTLFHGSEQSDGWGLLQSPSSITQGAFFGRSISVSGDINNDGFNDLVVGNTGSLNSPSGYSAVEIFHGNSNGFSLECDKSFQSNLQATLFGYEVEIVSDINGDNFDDVLISEPYNSSNAYRSGMVWVFYGNSTGVANQPDMVISGQINQLIGINILSAGDTNSDGFNDVLISHSGSQLTGTVELYLGSQTGLENQHYTVSDGGGNISINAAYGADFDGDGIGEFVFSQEIPSQSNSHILNYYIHTRNLWENKNFSVSGELVSMDLEVSYNGKTSVLVSSLNQGAIETTLFDNAYDGSSSGEWIDHSLTDFSLSNVFSSIAVSPTGLPYVVMSDPSNGVVLRTPKAMTALEYSVQTLGTTPEYIGHNLDSYDQQHIAYSTNGNTQIYLNVETPSGWTSDNVRNSILIESPIDVLTSINNSTHLIYRNSINNQIEYASNINGWNIVTLGQSGRAVSQSHSAIWLPNGDLAVGLIDYDGNNYNLSLWTWDGTTLSSSVIRSESDLQSQIKLAITDSGELIFATLTSTGSLSIYEKEWDSEVWDGVLIDQPSSQVSDMSIDLVGGENPVMVVNSASNSVYYRQGPSNWDSFSTELVSMNSGSLGITQTDDHYILFSTNNDSGLLQWSSLEKQGVHQDNAPWFSQSFKSVMSSSSNLNPIFDSNGTLNLAVISDLENKIVSLNFYLDSDRDLIFDKIDQLPHLSGQWTDSDGDGYGDNPLGPQFDSCPSENRTSSLLVFGCNDYDDDGYADSVDTCNNIRGFSWLGRTGCGDFDQDGWSDNKISYQNGDIFTDNWKQVFDSDGDGYGDNHGPDCCTTWYDTNAQPGDAFPYDWKQFLDWDGDGFGDNTSDLVGGDRCRFDYGTSKYDRNGCLDSDFDGYSDPSPGWGESDGADMWPFDPTQWADSDGDGFGDNGSINATNPDAFPNSIAVANDTDGDGFPDNFTSFYNGTNAAGFYIDGCPMVFGNSSDPLFGCLDSDGDGFMDIYSFDTSSTTGLRENQSGDAFPFDETQWKDTDGDGFGDQQFGNQADKCPFQAGVENGTLGLGCRIIDDNDDDGDFVINEDDQCPNTDVGLLVDLIGCAQNQIDDDGDGVFNDADICSLTPEGESVDLVGCSQAQKEVDTDGDGVFDFLDQCPNTPSAESSNSVGCSESQTDTDGDGVLDSVDLCPNTSIGAAVDSQGCVLAGVDSDGDGTDDNIDPFPDDSTQWLDSDGDGYGDNLLGNNADDCINVNGTSFEDRLGCLDSDGDGWSDPNQIDWFASPNGQGDFNITDPTQWRDVDGDGYGDNQSGNNPDLCPNTKSVYRNFVDSNGCADNEKDTDEDGIVDSLDNCPTEARGPDGYIDGCPLETSDSADESVTIFGMNILLFILVCVSSLVGLIIIISLLRGREDDEDWYEDEDWYDDEEYQNEPLSFLSNLRSSRSNLATSERGPTGSPRNMPQRGPPKGGSNPSIEAQSRGPSRSSINSRLKKSRNKPQTAKRIKSKEIGGKKVRKAKLDVDMDIFEGVDSVDRDSAIEWVVKSIKNKSSEREILMDLQENGWSAPQSRAIINLGKNR